MLKYTLGALAAAVILIGCAFVVLAQVTNGDANQGPAPNIIISVNDETVWPGEIRVRQGQIIDLALQNHSQGPRGARAEGEGVEQLPELTSGHTVSLRESSPRIDLVASAGMADRKLVRFNSAGEFVIAIYQPGVYFPPVPVRVIVE